MALVYCLLCLAMSLRSGGDSAAGVWPRAVGDLAVCEE